MPLTTERGPKLAAEAIGTFMLVAIGAGAGAVNVWSHGAVTDVGVSLAFGTAVLAAIYTLGRVSGAHINPAVTIAFWAGRRFLGRDVLPYILAQLAGACAAALGIKAVVGDAASGAVTHPAVGMWQACGVELALTFVLIA